MKSKFEIAKEMMKQKLDEAKTEEARSDMTTSSDVKSKEKPAKDQSGFHFKKPPRYMGILGILAGLSFFFFLTGELRSILECKNWPTVPGIIISSKVDEVDRMETNTLPDRKGMVSRFVYLPAVGYNYTVKGKNTDPARYFSGWMLKIFTNRRPPRRSWTDIQRGKK